MKWWVCALMEVCILCQASASEGETPPPDAKAAPERYQVLVQQNIFAKDRGRVREGAGAGEQKKDGAAKPEAEIVLVGIVQKDGQLAAFLENSKTGTVQTVRQDDVIAGGKIGAISLDSIEYVSGETSFTVSVGKTLEGGTVAKMADPAKPAGTGPSATPGSPETNSILERLRKKRQEEMGK